MQKPAAGQGTSDGYKSAHWGFLLSTSWFFFRRLQLLICFSRWIAPRTSVPAS